MKSFVYAIFLRALIPAALVVTLAWPSAAFAQAASTQKADQDHIVSPDALQQQVESSSANRQKNIETINELLSTPQADRAIRDHHIDAKQVHDAIPTLPDNELANLAARASHAQQDFSAGLLGVGLFTLIILLIIVIIVVAAVH